MIRWLFGMAALTVLVGMAPANAAAGNGLDAVVARTLEAYGGDALPEQGRILRRALPMLLDWERGNALADLGPATRGDGRAVRRLRVDLGSDLALFVEIGMRSARILRSAGVMTMGGGEMSFGAAYGPLRAFGPLRLPARETQSAMGQPDRLDRDRPRRGRACARIFPVAATMTPPPGPITADQKNSQCTIMTASSTFSPGVPSGAGFGRASRRRFLAGASAASHSAAPACSAAVLRRSPNAMRSTQPPWSIRPRPSRRGSATTARSGAATAW